LTKLTPWNVDTISRDKFAKTIINKEPAKKPDESLTEEERAERYVSEEKTTSLKMEKKNFFKLFCLEKFFGQKQVENQTLWYAQTLR
jgi:hypothetical protein